jgi:hypothetical protein
MLCMEQPKVIALLAMHQKSVRQILGAQTDWGTLLER